MTRKFWKNGLIQAAAVLWLIGPLFAGIEGRKVETIFDGKSVPGVKMYDCSGSDYFSLKQVAKLYNGSLEWHPITGKVTLKMHNGKLDFFIKSTKVTLDGKRKKLTLPIRLFSGQPYVPADFILSNDFSDFSETVSYWNPETNILTIENKVNILTPRFYTKGNTTKIVIELLDDLNHTWDFEKRGRLEVSLPRGIAGKEEIEVKDGIVDKITVGNKGRQAVISIDLVSKGNNVETSLHSYPYSLVVEITDKNLPPAPKPIGWEIGSSTISIADAGKPVMPVADNIPVSAFAQQAEAPAVEASTGTVAKFVPTEIVESDGEMGAIEIKPGTVIAPLPALKEIPDRQASKSGRKLIVLDAGHGGDDPGAIGPNGTKEKDINLNIVRELKKLFQENGGEYNIILTREDDVFIPLVERTNLANVKNADLFVSIHCNASLKSITQGFEIYFLSENASDSEAQATAVLENSVVRLEGKPNKKRAKLQELLWALVINEFINESSELCSIITKEITKRIEIENRGVKQAGFHVLRGARMPAVLVECAFLSNIQEEARLRSKRFQRKTADAVYDGIIKYLGRKSSLNAKK